MDVQITTWRRVITLTVFVVAVFYAGAIALGAGGQDRTWEWISEGPSGYRAFHINLIGVQLEFGRLKPSLSPGSPGESIGLNVLGLTARRDELDWRNAGIRWRNTVLGFPWWPLVAFLLARPALRIARRMDEARRIREAEEYTLYLIREAEELTRCAVCGYDLRATPQRCPECGTVPGA